MTLYADHGEQHEGMRVWQTELDDKLAPLLRRAGVHVAATVEMVIDLGGRTDHAAVEEDVEGRSLQLLLADRNSESCARVFFSNTTRKKEKMLDSEIYLRHREYLDLD